MRVPFSPASARDIIALHKQRYTSGVQDASIVPFTIPLFSAGIAVVIAFMLIHPSSLIDTLLVRWAIVGFITYWHIWLIIHCRSFNEFTSFAIGIVSLYLALWAATTLVFRDSKREFRRVESKSYVRLRKGLWGFGKAPAAEADTREQVAANGHNAAPPVRPSLKKMHGRSNLKLMAKAQVTQRSTSNGNSTRGNSIRDNSIRSKSSNSDSDGEYFWQGFPSGPFIERLEWVTDLYCSFRGTGWNWLLPGLPGPPALIQRELAANAVAGFFESSQPRSTKTQRNTTATMSYLGVPRFDTVSTLKRHNIYLLVSGYLIIDACKTIMTHDPHFWGVIGSPPPTFLPDIVTSSWALTRIYRLSISMVMMWMCLRTVFAMAPTVFVLLLGPTMIGPRGEPWSYPDHFGAYSNVLRRGLAGWWGGWWHQTFRFIFTSAAKWTLRVLGMSGREKSPAGQAVSLWVAFGLSGLLHASGSVTQMGNTRPWTGPFLFFMLQPLALLAEAAWRDTVLERLGWKGRVPWPVAYASNFVWVHAWGFCVAPMLVDDIMRGGLLLFEPFPFSLFRGLGLGAEGYGVWAWGGEWVRWHWDKQGRWWMSGIAI